MLHVVPRDEAFAISPTVTRGSEKWVDLIKHGSARAAVTALVTGGFELVSTHPEGTLTPEDLRAHPEARARARQRARRHSRGTRARGVAIRRVPMRGFVESLNLSVSAAILLRAATLGGVPEDSPTRSAVVSTPPVCTAPSPAPIAFSPHSRRADYHFGAPSKKSTTPLSMS